MNLLQIEIPARCRRFSETAGPFLPFVKSAAVLSAARRLRADYRCQARRLFQELQRHHPRDAPAELAKVLKLLAPSPERRRIAEARCERFRRERCRREAVAAVRKGQRTETEEVPAGIAARLFGILAGAAA